MPAEQVSIEDFELSRSRVIKDILADSPPNNARIDISEHYQRSLEILRNYASLDRDHRSDIKKLTDRIISYFKDKTLNRPLNVLMYAASGSGKSHLIKCLAESIDDMGISVVSYNIASLWAREDLIKPLEDVRNAKVADRDPVLFLDEFDTQLERNIPLLLPLLWDGELYIGHSYLKLGKVVIILAGSTDIIKKIVQSRVTLTGESELFRKPHSEKFADFLSRINGNWYHILISLLI